MSKDTLVIWGGNGQELLLENLDSHASVTAFFLSLHLSKYYNIVKIVGMDCPEQLLEHLDVKAIVSTFQSGFTSRLVEKGHRDLFMDLRAQFKGTLCSIVDEEEQDRKYYEDILFTVLPTDSKVRKDIRKNGLGRKLTVTRMGWCAEPSLCFPTPVADDEINVFIDHPPYSCSSLDYTLDYFRCFERIASENPGIKLNIYQQNNEGVVKWDSSTKLDGAVYDRANKVPWTDMMEFYKKCHVFCVTHPESAGLAVIEAAMCGAKIYVPVEKLFSPFISRSLINDGISYTGFQHSFGLGSVRDRITKVFRKDLAQGFTRQRIHQKLSQTNTWESAAERIHNELSKHI